MRLGFHLQSKKVRAESVGANGKAKRRYVRKAPRKLDTTSSAAEGGTAATTSATKKSTKQESSRSAGQTTTSKDDETEGSEPKAGTGQSPEASLKPDGQEREGDWKMVGDDVRYFPFREYNRKEKSLGLLCEKCVCST